MSKYDDERNAILKTMQASNPGVSKTSSKYADQRSASSTSRYADQRQKLHNPISAEDQYNDYSSLIDTTDLTIHPSGAGMKPFQQNAAVPQPVKPAATPQQQKLGMAVAQPAPFQQSAPVNPALKPSNPNVTHSQSVSHNPINALYQQIRGNPDGPTSDLPSTGSKWLDKAAHFVGESAGMILQNPVGGTEQTIARGIGYGTAKLLPKAAPVVTKTLANAATGAIENASAGAAVGQTSGKELAENAGVGAAFGGGGTLIGKGISATGRKVADIAENLIKNDLKAQQTLTGVGESGIRADAGKRILKDIDEQLQSVHSGNAPDKAEQYKTLMNDRAETIKYVQQHEPDFVAEKSRLQAPKKQPIPESEGSASSIPQDLAIGSDGAQNYAGNRIGFRKATQQNERTIARNKVVKNMRKNLGVVIDTGRLLTKNKHVLGQYKIQPEVVRSRMAEDLQVISHEIGHHLDKKYKLVSDPQYHGELSNVLQQTGVVNTAAYQPNQIPAEGIAEYVRLRLTDPDRARQLAPNFTQYFDSTLGPKLLQGLESSARDVDTWITQGDFNQAKGLLDFDSGTRKKPFNFNVAYSKFLDDLNPLKLVEKALKGTVGIGKDSVYKMARLSRGVGERAKLAITRGIYDDAGNKLSDGLAEIVKPLEKLGVSEEEFSTYLAVKHAMDLKAMGKQVPFDDNQIKAVMHQLDTPEMRSVQQGVIKFNNHLLDILVDAKVLSKNAVAAMRQKYPNYVPFMRYFDDDAIAGFKNGGFGAGKGFANIANPIKSMTEEGSTRTIINPIESIVKNTMLVMNAAAKNKVGLQLRELSKAEGAGAWVEDLGKGGSSPGEHVISVYVDGERHAMKIRDPELYNAMLSLDAESTNSLIKFLGASASLLRAGAVLTPEFTVRNAFRDIIGATINSTQYGFNPVDFAKGMFHVLGKTKTFDQFLSSGGAMSTMMSLDRDANREAMQSVFKKSLGDKAMNIVKSPKELAKLLSGYTPAKTVIGGLRKAAEVSELSTKVGSFNKTLKKTGSIEEAAYTARDLMDFNRAGSSIRQANRAVAFLNAALQGTDKMARAFKENPASFLTRAFTTLVLPSIGLYYYNKNLSPEMQEKYKNIPQWQKDNFFLVGIPGLGEFARIPKPFEAGMLFATGTERLMQHFEGHDPEAFKSYGRTVLQTFTPPAMITALTPIIEAITNYSFFRGGPIVNQGDQRFEKKDQYGLYTSETAKLGGQIMSHTPLKESNFASPKIIDNTIKGYTAGLGQYAVSGVDKVIDKAYSAPGVNKALNKVGLQRAEEGSMPAKKITEQPLARAFFVSSGGGGQVRDDFYTAWSKISAKKASADKNEVPFRDPSYLRLNAGYKIISKLNKQYKLVQNDKTMSSQEKRARLDILDEQMNQVAGKSLGK